MRAAVRSNLSTVLLVPWGTVTEFGRVLAGTLQYQQGVLYSRLEYCTSNLIGFALLLQLSNVF